MRNATTRFLALGSAALTLCLASCEGASSKRVGDMGSVQMALDVSSGLTLDTISYVINGPGSFTKMGSIDVSHSSTISADISPLPPGMGFTIGLSATSQQGDGICMGSQTFDVIAHQTTAVLVHLLCKQPTTNGSVSINGVLNVCPVIDSIGSSPGEVFVGGSILLSGQAHDSDAGPSLLTYQWTASPAATGSLNNASTQNATFVCAAPGTALVTLSVSDGDMTCADSQTISVICTSGGAATGGSGGSGGSGGAAGGTGGATGGSGGATGGSGGATGGSGGATGGSGGATGGSGGATGGAGGGTGGAGGGTGGAGGGSLSCTSSSGAAVIVYRVGDGTGSLVNTGNAVFLDGFGASVGPAACSTPLPTAVNGANHRLIASGTATSEGLISRSIDGHYIVLTGYDATPGGSSSIVSGTAARVVGRVDAAGNIDTTTALPDFSGNNPRSVASTDGINLWVAGAVGGARYATLGATSSVQVSSLSSVVNLRQVGIFGGQLYVTTSSGSSFRLGAVGAGLPTTTGQNITSLTGLPTSGGSPYGFFFADLDGAPGIDTVYVADDSASAPGGVTKYSLVAGTWTANGTAGSSADSYRGITGVVSGGTVTLYATRKGGSGATGGGELVSIVDAVGFNAAISGAPTLLATAAANTAFRGVALAPQ